jgi:hypothetical protein
MRTTKYATPNVTAYAPKASGAASPATSMAVIASMSTSRDATSSSILIELVSHE